MVIYIYSKTSEKKSVFEDVIEIIRENAKEIIVSIEHNRNFKELENIKKEMVDTDILLIGSLKSLGITNTDIANELDYFIRNGKFLVVCNIESTYKYGIGQPMNRAILKTILDSIALNNNIVRINSNKKSNVGRSKIEFPDNWEDLYEKWEKEEISSKKFMEESGLKKATFYNMVTEYKEILRANADFVKKFKLA
ncbi:hypothetical protein HMPREF0072_0782 [Anaerococcus lactolyticus ATCC 51172]|uniref:Resolvase/invertase-type recombinase catalytic domain-containing protein n=1 Tax=Anaerococcus lactolyticus ATCC 51172 TaxID=525254 RepID=C2BEL2_9FIRM|nr:hypothetical protein [Anaerococcus lactolyticus]EEI86685.1 hypothetical protein HMPREF0072_0782 [Anaerococcus lactolyticus ATCC 51172]